MRDCFSNGEAFNNFAWSINTESHEHIEKVYEEMIVFYCQSCRISSHARYLIISGGLAKKKERERMKIFSFVFAAIQRV